MNTEKGLSMEPVLIGVTLGEKKVEDKKPCCG
jgi:hypothetical protein